MAKVVNTDNYGGDYPNESWIEVASISTSEANMIAARWNALHCPANASYAPRYAKVVNDDYELQPGFEP